LHSKSGAVDIERRGFDWPQRRIRSTARGDDLKPRLLDQPSAGQLVDTLVTRGYLKRDIDSEDRRRLTIGLTERGRAAAKVLSAAGATIDAALLLRIGPKDLERARRALFVLVEIGRKMMEQEGKGNSVT
jgi:DNA-binding MarR family transcriptional regulator